MQEVNEKKIVKEASFGLHLFHLFDWNMSQNHIRTAFSTILVILTFLVLVFTLTKKSYLELGTDYPYYLPKQRNVSVNGSKYYSKTVQTPTHQIRSYTRDFVGENILNKSTLQVEVVDEFLSSSLDSKHLTPSSNSSLQSRPLKITNNSSINASVKIYIPATVPNELKRLRPMILNDFPSKFLPSYKNPCYIRYPEKQLQCLPYFFLLGTPKSGTTDIWSKIVNHPEIVAAYKEPHWWTRKSYPSAPLRVYEERYMTRPIKKLMEKDTKNKRLMVTGDGSASTFWDNSLWKNFYPEYDKIGPPYIMADVIHTVLPDAKLLVTLRDPTDRLYSDYVYFKSAGHTSPETFHKRVVEEIDKFSTCLTEHSLEACAYSSKGQKVRLNIGLYSLYLRDWLRRYPRDQLMVLKLEEWHVQCTKVLPDIYKFLEVATLLPTSITDICKKSSKNITGKKKRIGPMLNSTREILHDFYRPFVVRLASILNDGRFLWDYDDNHMLKTS